MKQEKKGSKEPRKPAPAQAELSAAWQELLGNGKPHEEHNSASEEPANASGDTIAPDASGETAIPTLSSDPWSELLHAKGVEVIDLHDVHLQISDQEVEQMLEVMQEQPDQETKDGKKNHP